MNYSQESERITNEIFTLLKEAPWKQVKNVGDGIKISRSPSNYPQVGNIYKASLRIKSSPSVVFRAINPMKPYRLQWDNILDKIELVEQADSNIYLIHHMSKPALRGLISARDSYDVVTMGENEDCFYATAASVTIPTVTVTNRNYIRAIQYPSGFIAYKLPDNPSECDFITLSNMDLNLNPLTKYLSDVAKPTLMALLLETQIFN